jgi:hypothetical protein
VIRSKATQTGVGLAVAICISAGIGVMAKPLAPDEAPPSTRSTVVPAVEVAPATVPAVRDRDACLRSRDARAARPAGATASASHRHARGALHRSRCVPTSASIATTAKRLARPDADAVAFSIAVADPQAVQAAQASEALGLA